MGEAKKVEKKLLVPNSVHTRPGQENSKKQKAKKFKKLKKPLPGIIFSHNGMKLVKKERKQFYTRIPFLIDPGKRIPKKIEKKNQKIIKPISGNIFSQNGG